MTYEIALEYRCGCRDAWQVSTQPRADDVTHTTAHVCVSEHCQTCQAAGRPCPGREALARYKPSTFTEIAPVRRLTRRKASERA